MLEAKISYGSFNDKGLPMKHFDETVEATRAIHWVHELAAFANNAASSDEDTGDQPTVQRTGSITLINSDWIFHVYFHGDFCDEDGIYIEFELFDRDSLGNPKAGPNLTSGRARITAVSAAIQLMDAGESPLEYIASDS